MPDIGKYDLYRYSPSIAAATISDHCLLYPHHSSYLPYHQDETLVLPTFYHWRYLYVSFSLLLHRMLIECPTNGATPIVELVGYVGRAIGHQHPTSTPAFIVQSVLILIAPAVFAATIYMTLGRLIRATQAESYSVIRVNWLTKCFVLGDVFTFFVQGGGGGILASTDPDKVKLGQNIILGGLFLQILLFGLFILVSIIFHVRLRKQPTQQSYAPGLRWQKMLMVLYAVSAIIMVRNIFRVVEYIGGRNGPLLRVEWPAYVFDALLMAATMAVWFLGYPTLIRPQKNLESDTENGMPLPRY
ncbi:MAG: hypothetical protein Q9220_002700 [cf. Caloplaca sp. 1 TL-2023]